jgi:integrase
MPSIIERNGRWRALIRKSGHTRCETFGTRKAAKDWAAQVETEIEELKATGVMQPRGQTLATLIDRYVREMYPVKRWGRSKSFDLAYLRKHFGHLAPSQLTDFVLIEHFRRIFEAGTGGVAIGARLGYLVVVLRTARAAWKLDVPVKAAQEARATLVMLGMVSNSTRRTRRVSDAEIAALVALFDGKNSAVPLSDIIRFCLATAMRIGEVCRLRWEDLDREARTVIIRDRKHPTEKVGNDQVVPLLNATGFDAFSIVCRQPQKVERIFPANERTVSWYFTRAVTKLKLPDLHLHDVRHEAISRLFAAGYQIQEVALVSGHRSWHSLKRYTHVRAQDLHAKAEKMEGSR